MTDTTAAAAVARQATLKRAALAADLRHLAEQANQFAARLEHGDPPTGEGDRLAQGALRIALQSVWLSGMQETIGWLNAESAEH